MLITYNLADGMMKVIKDRRSIREYTFEPVKDSDIDLDLRFILES